jgi:predicted RNase H-like nuclease (RuvC/YqgF family)
MSQEYNQYGSIALNYGEEEPQFNIFAEEEQVAEVVAPTKPKLTLKTKKLTKQQQREAEERADSKTGRTVAEVAAECALARGDPIPSWAVPKTKKEPTKKTVKDVAVVAEVAEPVVAELTLATIERLLLANLAPLNETVAQLKDKVAAVEARADDEDHAQKEGRKGYYQVKDGDEELRRLRSLNHDLRKEIEAKTKTNQKLQDQLDENPTEVNRLKEMNAALRKERDGARNGRKAAMETIAKLQRLLEENGISYEAD